VLINYLHSDFINGVSFEVDTVKTIILRETCVYLLRFPRSVLDFFTGSKRILLKLMKLMLREFLISGTNIPHVYWQQ